VSILPERKMIRKFLWLVLPDELLHNPTEAFCEWSPSNDVSTELTSNSNILVTS